MTRTLGLKHRTTPRQLLARILDEPTLSAQISALSPPVLAQLIERVGLEDAGEIVAFATTEQLARVFDEDLWQSERPGEDETFDAKRFVLWLEIMLGAGEAFVAERLAELPVDLVTLALHRHVIVLDLESRLAELGTEEAEEVDKALSNCLHEEIDVFLVVAREQEGWDTILTALLSLDREHHDLLVRILEQCCALTMDQVDDAGGLYEVLTADKMLEADVAAEREDRRAAAGFVAPSAASAFLKLARSSSASRVTEHDPLTRAWFRELGSITATPLPSKESHDSSVPDLIALLRESAVVEAAPPKLLSSGESSEPLLLRAMRVLATEADPAFAQRSEELAYLANVLGAGCSFEGRRMRPIEATRAALATTNLGLEIHLGPRKRDPLSAAVRALRELPADGLFRIAFQALHRDVILVAANAAAERLPRAAGARLRSAMLMQQPWRALAEVDALLETEDAAVVDAFRGLVDECPTLRGALGAPSGRAAAPRFFETCEEMRRAAAFVSGRQSAGSGSAFKR